MIQITTHVLDTARGKPAAGVPVTLRKSSGKEWDTLANGITNQDGRVQDLLAKDKVLTPGVYRIVFDTKTYFETQKVKVFYPYVMVVFEVEEGEKYHIPLLLSPFGYSTYRGS